MKFYILPLDPFIRAALAQWLSAMLGTKNGPEGEERRILTETHAACVTEVERLEMTQGDLSTLDVLLDTWGLEQSRDTSKAVGQLCSRIATILWKPPHRVTDDVPEAVAGPVADRQRSLFE